MGPIFSLPPATAAGGVTWAGSEAVIRLLPGPSFSGSTTDYWAPTNWAALDGSDADLGGSGPVLVDVPGATPSALVVQYGKDGKVYLLNRNNLGGVSAPITSLNIGGNGIQCARNLPNCHRAPMWFFAPLRDADGPSHYGYQSARAPERLECKLERARLTLCDLDRRHK